MVIGVGVKDVMVIGIGWGRWGRWRASPFRGGLHDSCLNSAARSHLGIRPAAWGRRPTASALAAKGRRQRWRRQLIEQVHGA
eukprot:scaffold168104_cov28-Tisochrysis_lutea.AAC.1